MSLIFQQIQNGQVVGNTTAATASNGEAKTVSTMNENKEMFLKLLVAEMQYQDPMEPKDNSEYVKELSQFTEVESLNSIKDEMEFLSAKTMVGKYVSIEDEDGRTKEGKVDYVTTSGGKNYVSVDGNLYEVSTIKSISDSSYFEDTTMASNVEQLINMLPDEAHLTVSDAEKVAQVRMALDGMNATSRSYLPQSTVERLEALEEKMAVLKERAALYEAQKAETAEVKEEAEEEIAEEIEEEVEKAAEETDVIVTNEEAATDESIIVNEVASEEVDEVESEEEEEEVDEAGEDEEAITKEEALTEDAITVTEDAGESDGLSDSDSDTDSEEDGEKVTAEGSDEDVSAAEDDYEPEDIKVAEVA